MRLVSFATAQGERAGLLRDGRVHPLGDHSLLELVEAGLEDLPAPGEPLAGVELLPPIGRPGKLLCIGLNYRAHAEEQGKEAPETPAIFAKFANALRPAGATVELPRFSDKVDYEADPDSGFPRYYDGEVVVRTRDGRVSRHRESINRGNG